MNDVVAYRESSSHALSALDLREQVNRIQDVMNHVMKEDVHYGKIPGTDKPTLYKPGAEVLCVTFRIAPSFAIEDVSTGDVVRYRVRAIATHQTTGTKLGEGMGECSSNELKYKWKKAFDTEFNHTPEHLRRINYGWSKTDRKEYEVKQVRVDSADVANTILKMACKRAHVAMTLNVLAASDCFAQDLEDLPEGIAGDDERPKKRSVEKPQSRSGSVEKPKPDDTSRDGTPATKGQVAYLAKELSGADGRPALDECLAIFKLATLDGITLGQWKAIKQWIADPTIAPVFGNAPAQEGAAA